MDKESKQRADEIVAQIKERVKKGNIARIMVKRGADTIAFASCIQKGNPIGYPCPFAKKMKEIIDRGESVIGDLHLFGFEDRYDDLCRNFLELRDQWTPVENIDLLAPSYLKSNEEYL